MANFTNCGNHHHLEDSYNVSNYFPFLYVNNSESRTVSGLIVFICIIGLFGNGIVLWFLCSNMKRNSFVFITNLAVADFGVVLTLSMNVLLFFGVNRHGRSNYAIYIIHLCLHNVYVCMHYASANFLMIISFDRCMAVLFPIWHRYHHGSKPLVATTSAFLWVLSCLVAGLSFFFRFCYQTFIINIIAFTTIYFLLVFSTVVLSVKVCCSSHLRQRGKLLIAILISLFSFIVTMVPRGLFSNMEQGSNTMSSFLLLLKAINSSINPIIYFFVGVLKASPARKTLKAVFQKFFKEEYTTEEGETSNTNTIAPTSATTTPSNCA